MFRKATKEEEVGADYKAVCQIAAGTTIEGAVSVKEANMRLDGEILGAIFCAGKLVLSATGRVRGDVQCFELISEGSVEGNVTAKGQIVLAKTASLVGDIHCKQLQIETGALFVGKCTMPRPNQPAGNSGEANTNA